jgi:adenosylmethionine-8-amino-7-oxononanoate aminotransferase
VGQRPSTLHRRPVGSLERGARARRVEIARAIGRQARELATAPTLLGFSTEPAVRVAARIADLLPAGLAHVVVTSGGSESN